MIGRMIHDKRFDTAITRDCYSACGLIWLAGKRRALAADAKLGFHMPWYPDASGKRTVCDICVAVVQSYETYLGLSADVLAFTNSADVYDIRRLSRADADRLGIEITPR